MGSREGSRPPDGAEDGPSRVYNLAMLRAQARLYQRQVRVVETERAELYRLIREARAAGHSLRAIAEASGLTFGRISQIT